MSYTYIKGKGLKERQLYTKLSDAEEKEMENVISQSKEIKSVWLRNLILNGIKAAKHNTPAKKRKSH